MREFWSVKRDGTWAKNSGFDSPDPGESQELFLHRVHVAQQQAPSYLSPVPTCAQCNPDDYIEARLREARALTAL